MQPSWSEGTRWQALQDGSGCPFCVDGPRGVIATLDASVVSVDAAVNVRGYCCLILKEHATELHALGDSAAADLMRDVRRAAAAVQRITGAIKLNYEIHGNVIPHIHMHIIPRYPGDAIERTGTGFARVTETPYAPGEFDDFAQRLKESLT